MRNTIMCMLQVHGIDVKPEIRYSLICGIEFIVHEIRNLVDLERIISRLCSILVIQVTFFA